MRITIVLLGVLLSGCAAHGVDTAEACELYEEATADAPCEYPCPWAGPATCDVERVYACADAVHEECGTPTPAACADACAPR